MNKIKIKDMILSLVLAIVIFICCSSCRHIKITNNNGDTLYSLDYNGWEITNVSDELSDDESQRTIIIHLVPDDN